MIRRRSYLRLAAAGVAGGLAVAGTGEEVPSLVQSGQAQNSDDGWEQTATLPVADNYPDEFTGFGRNVAYDGEKAVIAESGNDTLHVYAQEDGTWRREAALTPDGLSPADEDRTGTSVALQDGTALFGGGPTAYVFEERDGDWQQTGAFVPEEVANQEFNSNVAFAGDRAIYGAPLVDTAEGESVGTAYIFEQDDGDWYEQAKLLPDYPDHERFGGSLAGDSGRVFVSTLEGEDHPDSRLSEGKVYVYEEQDGNWTQTTTVTVDDGGRGHTFGGGISVDEDRLLVGAIGDGTNAHNAGAAYLFEEDGGDWKRQAKLVADDGAEGDQLGGGVALDDDTAVVGARNHATAGNDEAGAAYVFQQQDGDWGQTAKLVSDDPHEGAYFGQTVALHEDSALVGAPIYHPDRDPQTYAGAVYVFNGGDAAAATEQGGTETATETTSRPEQQEGDEPGLPWEILAGLGGLGVAGYLLKHRRDGEGE